MVDKSAICTIVGAVWLEFTVCPSSTTIATTVPSAGEVMRVCPKSFSAVLMAILVWLIDDCSSLILAREVASASSVASNSSRDTASSLASER